ncbi:hypothetical protein C162_03824 [Paenibacillus sp. FSL R7-269]|nr:hypothetical protein C162_03824 [Paenibacillus sp. FSL R7-269]
MICLHCGNRCQEVRESVFRCSVCNKGFEQSSWDFDLEETESLSGGECGTLKNFQVTELNISLVPVDWLFARYQKLKKSVKITAGGQKELMVIREYLEKTGRTSVSSCDEEVEQTEMDIPVAIRQQYVSIVEYRLKQYYQANKRKQWLHAELQTVRPKEPKVTAGMELTGVSGRSGIPHSSTEQAVMSMFDKAERLQDEIWEVEDQLYPMEKALRCLDPDQLKLVEAKYFCREEELDEYLMNSFNWYRAKYYQVKKTALILLAQSLRII